jgi:hypothetical protein
MHQPQQHIHYSRTSRDFQPETFTNQLQFQHKAVAKGPKLSFPEFDGTDPDGWIRKAEKYFELVGVPTEDRVQLAVLYIKGKAEFRWRGTGYSPNNLQWYQFCRWLGARFSDTSTYEAVGQFHSLRQMGSVNEYIDKFEELMSLVKRDNPFLRDEYFTCSFVSGLKEPIQHHLQCYKPRSLVDAFWYAKRLEQATTIPRKPYPPIFPARTTKPWAKEARVSDQKDANSIAELKAAGKCFKCREPWIPGHTKVCKGKQVFSVILMESAEGKQELGVVQDGPTEEEEAEYFDAEQIPVMQLSLHALLGTAHPANTFTLQLQIGKHIATALVDTGTDVSFINAKFAIKANIVISPVSAVQVVVANGKHMLSNTACVACPYSIQGCSFQSDFRLLEIQGYDIILGADWVYTHSPVGLNLKTREISITKNGHHCVTFSDETKGTKNMLINPKTLCKLLQRQAVTSVLLLKIYTTNDKNIESLAIPQEIQTVLQDFEDIFQTPVTLPPKRSVDHAITLIDDSKSVNQRPYRLPYHQKNAMEELIHHMLDS